MAFPRPLEKASIARPAFETKRAAVSVSAITKNGSFEGYASLFNVVDLGRDLVLPGAFKDSLSARQSGSVKMLWQHDAAQVIGSWTRIVEDHKGLKVSGQLNLAVAKAREVYALMLEGAVDGLSIGFRVQQAAKDPSTGVRRLSKLDLWEISVVTFPMLPAARVEQVKRQPCTADARLAAAKERGTRIATDKKDTCSNFKLAAAINACMAILNAKLFDPNQPRDDQGKWTSGGAISPSSKPEASRTNISRLLNQWSELASGSNFGPNLIIANNLDALAGTIIDWLGPGSFQQNSPNGSIQFFSSDRLRIIRFDLGGHGLGPHINVEPGRIHIFI